MTFLPWIPPYGTPPLRHPPPPPRHFPLRGKMSWGISWRCRRGRTSVKRREFFYKNCTKSSKICTEIKKLGQNVTDLENIYGKKKRLVTKTKSKTVMITIAMLNEVTMLQVKKTVDKHNLFPMMMLIAVEKTMLRV